LPPFSSTSGALQQEQQRNVWRPNEGNHDFVSETFFARFQFPILVFLLVSLGVVGGGWLWSGGKGHAVARKRKQIRLSADRTKPKKKKKLK